MSHKQTKNHQSGVAPFYNITMNPQTISIDKIKPNPDNPRTISDKKLQQLVRSIQAFPEMLKYTTNSD